MDAAQIILECVKRKIPVSLVYNENTENICYEVHGFAKCEFVRIDEIYKQIEVRSPLNSVEYICTFMDFVRIAKSYHDYYSMRGYSTGAYWLKVFIEFGLIEKKS